ncbi:MAG: SDR family NAD(P)-dependent oxidoreductase [Ilumatobacteraceae bacterium]
MQREAMSRVHAPINGEFEDRGVFVSGGTSGIGAAVARAFAAAGANVVILGRRSEAGSAVVEEIRATGGTCEFVRGDIRRSTDVDRAIEIAQQRGGLRAAVNSAGIFDRSVLIDDYSDDAWEEMIAINLSGVFRCLRAEMKAMKAHGGAIVNIGSSVGHRGSLRGSPGYVAAKHGVIGLTRQCALECAEGNIRVNSVSPGPTLTEMAAPLVAEGPEAVRATIGQLNPTGRFVDPAVVAGAVVFLCSGAADGINGADLAIDGGQLAKL